MEIRANIDELHRRLSISANEMGWSSHEPMIFLGEWCTLYGRRHIWSKLNIKMAAPYGISEEEKNRDASESRKIEEGLFEKLYPLLNSLHCVNHSPRYWRILIGHWLRRQVEVTINRSRTLENCVKKYRPSKIAFCINGARSLCSQNTEEALRALASDDWNELFFLEIYKELIESGKLDSYPEKITIEFNQPEVGAKKPVASSFLRKVLTKAYQIAGVVLPRFAGKHDAFIVNSYLSKWMELKLQLRMFQVPQFWIKNNPEIKKSRNKEMRNSLSNQLLLEIKEDSNLSRHYMHAKLLVECMPLCYMEAYSEYSKAARNLKWPMSPRFIFTSNNFDTDESFKFWTASKVETGIPYYVGAHGNYGVTKFDINPGIEEITSDKFLTWGWRDGLKQHTPAYVFTIAGRNKVKHCKDGGLLLVQVCEPHRMWTWDATYEHAEYVANQYKFVSLLDNDARAKLTVRLHSGHVHSRWSDIERWCDFDKDIQLDLGRYRMRDILTQYRLVVHSYDSTGIVETLAQNIPTMMFWLGEYEMTRDSALPFYKILHEAGILHFSATEITEKINSIWHDVDAWWYSDAVQTARSKFCSQYGRMSLSPVGDLVKIFNDLEEDGRKAHFQRDI